MFTNYADIRIRMETLYIDDAGAIEDMRIAIRRRNVISKLMNKTVSDMLDRSITNWKVIGTNTLVGRPMTLVREELHELKKCRFVNL